jgi:hypothetical protein
MKNHWHQRCNMSFVVSAKCIDPWILEFMVLNITGNNLWENCILLDFYFRGLNVPRNQQKMEPHNYLWFHSSLHYFSNENYIAMYKNGKGNWTNKSCYKSVHTCTRELVRELFYWWLICFLLDNELDYNSDVLDIVAW